MPRTPRTTDGSTGSAKPTRPSTKKPNGNGASVSNEEVAKRAYEIYQGRGGHHGADMDDWFEAERQLKQSEQQAPRRRSPRP